MADAVNLPGARLAGLFADLSHKIQKGAITLDELALFNQCRNPFEGKPVVKAVKKAVAVLALIATATASAVTERMDPNDFFQDCPGLYIFDDFKIRVLPALRPFDSAPKADFSVSRLKQAANDTKIRKELSENHLAEWYHIATLITQQKNGEEGVLLTNGYANIFYMLGVNGEVFTVSVRWLSHVREWRVRAWQLGGRGQWFAGYQVFSRNSQTV